MNVHSVVSFSITLPHTLRVLPQGHPRLSRYREAGCLGYSSYPAAQLQVCDSNLTEPQTYATYTSRKKLETVGVGACVLHSTIKHIHLTHRSVVTHDNVN